MGKTDESQSEEDMKTTPGKIYQLGDHTLGCGSSLDAKFVAEVVGKKRIRAVLTDPPYGVAYVESTTGGAYERPSTKNAKAIVSDHLQTESEYAAFTARWLSNVKPFLDHYNAFYIFNADSMYRALRNGLDEAGFFYSQMIIWVKNTVVIGRKDYLPMHELCAYGWYGRHKMEREKAKSVLFHPKPSSSRLHPTMKPVGLLRKLLPNSTKAGEYVYDPFLGSGSTLIACEQLGRKCIGIELDTGYCDTIIARWEKLTGGKAIEL